MIDKKKIPQHVAVIMDGNGRWARRRGLARIEGHRRGLKVIKEIIRAADELGVKYLTLYAFSSENWKRSNEEVDFLMAACQRFIEAELPGMMKNNLRFRHIGRLQELSESLRRCIAHAEAETKNNSGLCVQLAFNYGARLEIIDAVKSIAREVQAGRVAVGDIDEEMFARSLYTKDAPDPDLLVRTSGEERISNFLLWQLAYAEFYMTKKFWPDFSKREFLRAIAEYQKRSRRFGGVNG